MDENTRVNELKSYIGSKQASGFLAKLIAAFYLVAIIITVIAAASGRVTPMRVFGPVALWAVAIAMHVMSVTELKKSSLPGGGLPKDNAELTAVLEDFEKAIRIQDDKLRTGFKYVYVRGGGMTPYTDILRVGARVLPLQEARYIQFYAELVSGKQLVIYQEEESAVNKADTEAIIFNLGARNPSIRFIR